MFIAVQIYTQESINLHIKGIHELCSHCIKHLTSVRSSILFGTNTNNRKKTVITFPVIDRVCYKVAKEKRRKEQRRTNKTDIFSTNNSTQNG